MSEKQRRIRKERNAAIAKIDDVISAYKKEIAYETIQDDEEKGSTIHLDLTSIDIYDPLSKGSRLNPEIYDYVEDTINLGEHHNHLNITFTFPEKMSQQEKDKIFRIFNAHYAVAYRDSRARLTKQMILAILFVFMGFFFISIHWLYSKDNAYSVYGEILDIFGWVLIWEAGSSLFVNSLDEQKERARYLAFYLAPLKEQPTK
ncbi:MAG: hypothetical protein BWY98_00975 [Tenericutes bacterium ADurb.BinA155]|jgi:hypothetical protein|nr:MAG: hypothetical protein BWY98_00975 [Tenericutes bacterium ADurb.BinA155]